VHERPQELQWQWQEVVQGNSFPTSKLRYVLTIRDQIDQEGMTAPPLSGTNWGTNKVMKNLYWESVVPKTLAPGNYLVRHELLALHQAKTPQFYAECAQSMLVAYAAVGTRADSV
jgi:hypothetical protein